MLWVLPFGLSIARDLLQHDHDDPWIYSALYNAAYMLPDMVVILVIGAILLKTPAKKYITGQDLT